MAKKGEVSLSAKERFKDFSASQFQGGDRIIYKSDGRWQVKNLDNVPDPIQLKDKRKIVAKIDNADVSLNVPPLKVEFADGSQVPGTNYTVQKVRPGPNGEVWYDLEAGGKVVRNVDQEILAHSRDLKELEDLVSGEVPRLIGEMQTISTERAGKLMDSIVTIRTMIDDARLSMGKAEANWNRLDDKELTSLEQKAEELKRKIKDEIELLDNKIKDFRDTEQIDNPRAWSAVAFEQNFADELKLVDEKAKQKFDKEEEQWKKKDADYKDWERKIEDLKKDLIDAKTTARGKQASQQDKDYATSLSQDMNTLRGEEPRKPDVEPPKLEKPSESEEDKRDLMFEIFEKWEQSLGEPDFKNKNLIFEVRARRQAQAKREEGRADYPGGNARKKDAEFLKYRQVTVDILKTVLEEWKKLSGDKEAVTNDDLDEKFEVEKEKLRDKAEALLERAEKLPDGPAKNSIINGIPPLQGLKDDLQKIIALNRATSKSAEIFDLWQVLAEWKNEIHSVEKGMAEDGKTKEAKIQFVDLPKDLMLEWLNGQAPLMREALGNAYLAKIEEGAGANAAVAAVEANMKVFISNIQINEALRDRLASLGIKDWEAFQQQWEDKLAKSFSGVMMEMADSDLKTKIFQAVKDIKNENPRFWELGEQWEDIWDYSALANMKAAAAWRMLINVAVLAPTGIGMSLLTRIIPSAAVRATLVGGTIGAVKAGLQRFMGKDGGYFQRELKEGKRVAEQKKKLLIRDELLKGMFDASGAFNAGADADDKLAYMFTAAMRRTTQEASGKNKITISTPAGGGPPIELTGDEVCMYYDALKMAAEDAGENQEDSDQVKYKLAAALFALRNNEKFKLEEIPPGAVKATQWLMDAYTGRIAANPGRPTVSFAGGAEGKEVTRWKQVAVTAGIGGAVGLAIEGGRGFLGQELQELGAVRGVVGGAMGLAAGERAAYQSERSKADKTATEFLQKFTSTVDGFLKPLQQNAGETPDAFQTREKERVLQVQESNTLLTFLLQGADIKYIPPISRWDKKEMKFLTTHTKDIAGLLQRNKSLHIVLESLRREIARSGDLQKAGIMNHLDAMQKTGKELEQAVAARNGLGVRILNDIKRHGRGVLYGAGSAVVSIGAGVVIDKVRMAIFGDSVGGYKFVADADGDKKSGPAAIPVEAKGAAVAAGAVVGLRPSEHLAPTGASTETVATPTVEHRIPNIDGMEVKDIGTEKDLASVDARGPWTAGMHLKNWFEAHGARWSAADVNAELVRHGYKFHYDGQGHLLSEEHPVVFQEKGGALAPWIGADGKPHFEIVDLKDGKGISDLHGGHWVRTIGEAGPKGVKVDFPESSPAPVAAKEGLLVNKFTDPKLGNVVEIQAGSNGQHLQVNFNNGGKYLGHSGSAERPLDEAIGEIYKQAPEAKAGGTSEALSAQGRITRSLDDLDHAFQVLQQSGQGGSAEAQGLAAEVRSLMGNMSHNTKTAMADLYQPEFLQRYFSNAQVGADHPAIGTAGPMPTMRGGGGGGMVYFEAARPGAEVSHTPVKYSLTEWKSMSGGGGAAQPEKMGAVAAAKPAEAVAQSPTSGETKVAGGGGKAAELVAEFKKGMAAMGTAAETMRQGLHEKGVMIQDSVAGYTGSLNYSGSGAEVASNLLTKLELLSSAGGQTWPTQGMAEKLVQLDVANLDTPKLLEQLKAQIGEEAQVFYKNPTATLGGHHGGEYHAAVSDHPSHAIALVDEQGNRTVYRSDSEMFSQDKDGRVLVTGADGKTRLGDIAFEENGGHNPVVKAADGEVSAPVREVSGDIQEAMSPLLSESDRSIIKEALNTGDEAALDRGHVSADLSNKLFNQLNESLNKGETTEMIKKNLTDFWQVIKSSELSPLEKVQGAVRLLGVDTTSAEKLFLGSDFLEEDPNILKLDNPLVNGERLPCTIFAASGEDGSHGYLLQADDVRLFVSTPGISFRIDPALGELQYRDAAGVAWQPYDKVMEDMQPKA